MRQIWGRKCLLRLVKTICSFSDDIKSYKWINKTVRESYLVIIILSLPENLAALHLFVHTWQLYQSLNRNYLNCRFFFFIITIIFLSKWMTIQRWVSMSYRWYHRQSSIRKWFDFSQILVSCLVLIFVQRAFTTCGQCGSRSGVACLTRNTFSFCTNGIWINFFGYYQFDLTMAEILVKNRK